MRHCHTTNKLSKMPIFDNLCIIPEVGYSQSRNLPGSIKGQTVSSASFDSHDYLAELKHRSEPTPSCSTDAHPPTN